MWKVWKKQEILKNIRSNFTSIVKTTIIHASFPSNIYIHIIHNGIYICTYISFNTIKVVYMYIGMLLLLSHFIYTFLFILLGLYTYISEHFFTSYILLTFILLKFSLKHDFNGCNESRVWLFHYLFGHFPITQHLCLKFLTLCTNTMIDNFAFFLLIFLGDGITEAKPTNHLKTLDILRHCLWEMFTL